MELRLYDCFMTEKLVSINNEIIYVAEAFEFSKVGADRRDSKLAV